MPILALGVSYRRASVEMLERLAFPVDSLPKAYRQLRDLDSVREAVIVSTCNRVEVYGEVGSYHAGFLDLKRFLSDSREVGAEEFAEPLYSHYEEDAAEHLFGVAAGIDSMVLGEPQILTQVRGAYQRAQGEGATGAMLSALFRAAIRAGRRARSETAIGASPGAFVEAGARVAERSLGTLHGAAVVVVGAGEMARLAVRHLQAHAVGSVRIVNRSVERAARLAGGTGAAALGLEDLAAAVAQADVVVSSTGAAGLVIGREVVRRAVRGRRDRPLFLLDLAVPRDVDPAVAALAGVRLVDIDGLREVLAEDGRDLGEDVERVRRILTEEVARFAAWRRAARLAPLIQALRDRGAAVQASELARVAPRLGSLSERERQAVEQLAQGIVAKLLHDPIVRLKATSGPGAADSLAQALADLFGIDFSPGA